MKKNFKTTYKNTRFISVTKSIMIVLAFIVIYSSCKKDDDPKEEEREKKFSEIIRAEDISILKKNGMQLYEGSTPPVINGIYEIRPWRLDFANPEIGMSVGDTLKTIRLMISEQTSGKSSVKLKFLYKYMQENSMDPQSIYGSGNNFTIYYKYWIKSGPGDYYTYPFAIFISGTVDGKNLKDVKMARVGLKYQPNPDFDFSVEGNITIYSDADGLSEGFTPMN